MSTTESMQRPEYVVASLSTLMESLGEERVSNMLSSFQSSTKSDTETFLHEKAMVMERRDVSRTYVCFSSDDESVLGYVTIGIKCLTIPDNHILPSRIFKKMNIDNKNGVAQSYIIGQLSRSKDSPQGFGTILMDVALRQLMISKIVVGCRLVRLDCQEELIPYYQRYGFRSITGNENADFNQMLMVF